jgi:hypothetical protein
MNALHNLQSPSLGGHADSDPAAPTRPHPEDLRRYADLLDQEDHLLLTLTETAMGHRAIARILRVAPGSVSRKLRDLERRLRDPICRRLFDPHCPLSPAYRQVGVEHFFIGKPLGRIARETGQTFAAVRLIVDHVKLWHQLTQWSGPLSRYSGGGIGRGLARSSSEDPLPNPPPEYRGREKDRRA